MRKSLHNDDFITLFVAYFDEQTGALHLIQRAKYYFSHFFFYLINLEAKNEGEKREEKE